LMTPGGKLARWMSCASFADWESRVCKSALLPRKDEKHNRKGESRVMYSQQSLFATLNDHCISSRNGWCYFIDKKVDWNIPWDDHSNNPKGLP
jgi:hypothetical protein